MIAVNITRRTVAMLALCLATPLVARPATGAPQDNLTEFAALVDGTFETAPDDPDNSITSRWTRIRSSAFGGIAFYGQLNTGPDRKLYRQRVYIYSALPDGTIVAKSHGLREPARFADAWLDPAALDAITPADLAPALDLAPGASCDMVWRRTGDRTWSGRIDPGQCRLWSARLNQAIGLEAESHIEPGRIRQTERGYDAGGRQLFGTAPGTYITLFRRP